jgi:hypothetical protein
MIRLFVPFAPLFSKRVWQNAQVLRGEVRKIYLLRDRVNRSKKKGRSVEVLLFALIPGSAWKAKRLRTSSRRSPEKFAHRSGASGRRGFLGWGLLRALIGDLQRGPLHALLAFSPGLEDRSAPFRAGRPRAPPATPGSISEMISSFFERGRFAQTLRTARSLLGGATGLEQPREPYVQASLRTRQSSAG